ncbi:MAG TPA: pseudouridine synthase [Paracoccaceae bacterium]|nr:pseudouridine synthase [Paracoccaceae bacterium]
MTERDDDGNDGRERIAKRLSRAGVASRRVAETMIAEGRVTLDGRRVTTPATLVGPGARLAVDGREVAEPEPPRLWRYHKPAGLVTTEADEKGRPTVFERLPPEMPRVLSVGRLDLTSEGLLLLTNDGGLKRRLELPATGWLRRYRVRVHGVPGEADLDRLRRGIEVEGERFRPMSVAVDRQQGANCWLTVSLREGRNREVRRALGALGFDVSRLIRIGYGPFQLGDLTPGAVEEVRPKVLREQLGLPPAEPARAGPGRAPGAGGGGKAGGAKAGGGANAGTRSEDGAGAAKSARGPGRGGGGRQAGPGRRR